MSVKERVDAILTENIGKVLSLDLASKMSVQIVESVLMTRELAGLPEEPGKSTNIAQPKEIETVKSKKGKDVIQAKPMPKAIVSAPFEGIDPGRDIEDQPDTMPFTIRRGQTK